jgi:hypothetical protein
LPRRRRCAPLQSDACLEHCRCARGTRSDRGIDAGTPYSQKIQTIAKPGVILRQGSLRDCPPWARASTPGPIETISQHRQCLSLAVMPLAPMATTTKATAYARRCSWLPEPARPRRRWQRTIPTSTAPQRFQPSRYWVGRGPHTAYGQSPRNSHTRICIREMENRVALDPWPLAGMNAFRQAQR